LYPAQEMIKVEYRGIAKAWEEAIFEKDLLEHEVEFFPMFLEYAKKANRILEVGAGNGRMIRILRKNGVKSDFFAVDITRRVKEINDADANSVMADARTLPFKNESFDFVYSLGVIEHFPETEQAIKEQSRVLRKGGYIFITTPHFSLFALQRYFKYLKEKEYKKGTFEEVKGRNLRLKDIKKWCESANLKVIENRAVSLTIPFLHRFKFYKSLNRIFPSDKFGSFLYCIAEK